MNIKELGDILKEKGIVGAGGAGFPSYGKLSDKIDVIVMNCAECEPLLKLHRQLLRKHADEILKAFHLVAETVGAKRAVIGIKKSYKSTIEALEMYIGNYSEMSIHTLPDVYPMGDEVVLIYEAIGKVVPPGGLPIECGAAVFNVETMYNIYRAVWEDKAVTHKYVTVAGEVKNPVTLHVPIGMRVSDVVALAKGVTTDNPIYISGGPMMGKIITGMEPVTKTTSGIIVLPQNHPLIYKRKVNMRNAILRASSACCQCRTCTDLCPRHALGYPVEPHLFMRAAANRDFNSVFPYINTMYCSSCGLCEMYSCPQGLSPRSIISEYKAGLRKAGFKGIKPNISHVKEDRQYRMVPESRLKSRLRVEEYDKDAPLDETYRNADSVYILLSQHIGAPSLSIVKLGQDVKEGDMIAKAAEGLSVCTHASIDGEVAEINERYIKIKRK